MFKNRMEAGKLLGKRVKEEIKSLKEKTVVLGIPRGGMVPAKKVAEILNCPLDVIVVKKIGAPGNSELAVGAIGETKGSSYINNRLIKNLGDSIE